MNLPTGSRQIWFNNPQHIFFHMRPLCKDSRFISVASKCLQLKFHNVLWLIPETYIIRQWELNWWVPNIGYWSQTHINFNYNPCHYFHDPRGLAYEVFFFFLLQLREFTAWIYKQCFDILIDDFPTNPNIIELFLCSSLWFHGFSWIFFKILLTRNIFRINLKALTKALLLFNSSLTLHFEFFLWIRNCIAVCLHWVHLVGLSTTHIAVHIWSSWMTFN